MYFLCIKSLIHHTNWDLHTFLGPPGKRGPVGMRGGRGASGLNGHNGRDGAPGLVGESGEFLRIVIGLPGYF